MPLYSLPMTKFQKSMPARLLRAIFWKAEGVSWTLKTREEYETAVQEGWIPIFEGFIP